MSFFKDLTKNFEQLSSTLGGDKKKEKALETQQQPSYGELSLLGPLGAESVG
jgi:hypothetical protein